MHRATINLHELNICFQAAPAMSGATATRATGCSWRRSSGSSAPARSQDAARVRLRALLRAQPRGTFLQHHQALSRHRNPLRKDCQKLPRRRPPRLRPGLAQMTTSPSPLSQIALLDPLVAQQVAAGEVVDRPASVVKELSENALDSAATRVEVEISDGGRERMLVRDDGSGMSEEDAKLSVLRHATSKIRSATDIEAVMTLGFRGEALPSIASVSAFSLTTSTGAGAGTNVTTDGGGNVTVSAASHSKGTTVLVDRLFYNVPARRAFLKSARAERAAVVETMTNLAIAHPGVMFRLTEKGKEVLSLPAAKDLIERLAQLYGVGKARAMRRVDYESGAYKVTGYAAWPSVTEGSRSRQTVSVNGRWVRAEGLTKGIDDAYRATVPAGRYPPVALLVGVDPHRVDVNVHPTKQLVRFSDDKEVRLTISEAIRNVIQGTGDSSPEQDGRSTQSETPDATLPPATESG